MEPRHRLYLLIAAALAATTADAKTLLTQKEALALAFPAGVQAERRTAYLTDAQTAQAEAAAGGKVESRVWTYYVGASSGGATASAYFESHRVRTMNETFMVVVGTDSAVRFVEILSFAEPDEYLPPKKWLAQFGGRPLDREMMLGRGLRNLTGASISSDAMTRAVRRILAVHQVLNGPAARARTAP